MVFLNAKKRKLNENTSGDNLSNKSHKRNKVPISSTDRAASSKDSEPRKNAVKNEAESTKPKVDTDLNQSTVVHTSHSSSDVAPFLQSKNDKNILHTTTAKQRQHSLETLKSSAKEVLPTNKAFSSSDAFSTNVGMPRAKHTNTSGASSADKTAKQRRASPEGVIPLAPQAASVKPTNTGSGEKTAEGQASSSELSSLDQDGISSVDVSDVDADAASRLSSKETLGEMDGSEEEESNNLEDDDGDDGDNETDDDETDYDEDSSSSSSDEPASHKVVAKYSSSDNKDLDNLLSKDRHSSESLSEGPTLEWLPVDNAISEDEDSRLQNGFYDFPFESFESESEPSESEEDRIWEQELRMTQKIDDVEQTIAEKERGNISTPSSTSSESSLEWTSKVVIDRQHEVHTDMRKKEVFKADDPNAFAASMSNILGHKLTRQQRTNPILARSKDAKLADAGVLDSKLEKRVASKWRKDTVEQEGGWLVAAEGALARENARLDEEELEEARQRQLLLEKLREKEELREAERQRRREAGISSELSTSSEEESEDSYESFTEDDAAEDKSHTSESSKASWTDPVPSFDVYEPLHGEEAGGQHGKIWEEDADEKHTYYRYQQPEKAMRKTAERGVIKMFNAFAKARGDQTGEQQRLTGSRAKKEEKATEMTKERWLNHIAGGDGGGGHIEEMEKSSIEEKDSLPRTEERSKVEEKGEPGNGTVEIEREDSLSLTPLTEEDGEQQDGEESEEEEQSEEEEEIEEEEDSEQEESSEQEEDSEFEEQISLWKRMKSGKRGKRW